MAAPLSAESVTRLLAQAVSDAWASTPIGAAESFAPGGVAEGTGWLIAVPAAGAATGRLAVWFESQSALACARRALIQGDDATADDAKTLLTQLVARAAAVVEAAPEGAGLSMGDATIEEGPAPAGAQGFLSRWAGDAEGRFAVLVALGSSANAAGPVTAGDDSRLEAVLDVDLPLVVRFGRAVMPLRSVAELSPGSVVDMGRSPDEPVELLVGERLIARGEVVIVGGNYGVRITELTSGRRSTDLEARS